MGVIHVIGLGPGDMSGLPLGAYQLLKAGYPVYLRTEVHPAATELRDEGLQFTAFDDLYESGSTFEEIYKEMAARLISACQLHGEIVYAVPGHPLVAEQSVQNLYDMVHNCKIEVGSGQSFLDVVCSVLKVDPIEGFALLDGTMLKSNQIQPSLHTFVAQVFQQAVASDVKLTLMNVLPDDYMITVVRGAGVVSGQRIEKIPLYALDHLTWIDHLTTVYIPPSRSEDILRRDLWFAPSLVEKLRQPDGCPWDRKQTHESLRAYVIEEAFEVASAIDAGDPDALVDELGDLLLQILLHAQIASEYGAFQLRDVFATLSDKLIRRHPHVFGGNVGATEADAQRAWEASKEKERTNTGLLADIKVGRPSSLVAQDIQTRAAKAGFDWLHVKDVLEKLKEEMIELEAEVLRGNVGGAIEELGDVAFTAVNLARWLNADFETVLAQANLKFMRRFTEVERKMTDLGKSWSEMDLESLENLWKDVKKAGIAKN